MRLSLAQAAETTGKGRSTILRSIKAGRLSADRDELTQAWMIDAAELHRLYPPLELTSRDHTHTSANGQPRTSEVTLLAARLEAAETRIADAQETIADLRRRLDKADERLLMLLADQRAPARPVEPAPAPPPRTAWRRFLRWRSGN